MSHTRQYQSILNESKTDRWEKLKYRIMKALLQFPDGLTRQELVREVFGQPAQHNINNDARDRKIRKAIGQMRERGLPIVATSDRPGYRLETNPQQVQKMMRELRSRFNSLAKKFSALQAYCDLYWRNPHGK